MAKVKDIAMQIRGVSYHPEDLHDNLDEDSVVLLRANNIKDGKLILDDSFNGNLDGMLEAVRISSTYEGRRVIITPGIVENS